MTVTGRVERRETLRLTKTIVNLTDHDKAKVVIYNWKEETTAAEKWAA